MYWRSLSDGGERSECLQPADACMYSKLSNQSMNNEQRCVFIFICVSFCLLLLLLLLVWLYFVSFCSYWPCISLYFFFVRSRFVCWFNSAMNWNQMLSECMVYMHALSITLYLVVHKERIARIVTLDINNHQMQCAAGKFITIKRVRWNPNTPRIKCPTLKGSS